MPRDRWHIQIDLVFAARNVVRGIIIVTSHAHLTDHRHLARFPNIDVPLRIAEYSSQEASSGFHAHIESGLPCVIRNAVAHWPAYERWGRLEYWTSVARDVQLKVIRSIQRVYGKMQFERMQAKDAVTAVFTDNAYAVVMFDLGPMRAGDRDGAFAVAGDVGSFPFGPSWINWRSPDYARPREYPSARAFLHRKSYTDWHDHGTDDTLTIQVVGKKLFLLLPPEQRAWALREAVFTKELHLGSSGAFEQFGDVRPYAATLHAGDVIFIPPFWQHAAASVVDDLIGVTLACTYATPVHRLEPPSWRV